MLTTVFQPAPTCRSIAMPLFGAKTLVYSLTQLTYNQNKMTEIIKNNVHECRTKIGLTQEQLAEKVGVTRQTVIAIERGNYTPSVLLALKLAKVFSTSVESLFSITYE